MKTKEGIIESNKKDRYKEEYLDLIDCCSSNVNSLTKCAGILLDEGIYSKSLFMSYGALEELGKRLLICDYVECIISENEFKKTFSDHSLKIAYLHNRAEIVEDGIIIKYDKEKFEKWFELRNKSLYVDYRNNKISDPKNEITKQYATDIYNHLLKMIEQTNFCEEMNSRLGSKAIYK